MADYVKVSVLGIRGDRETIRTEISGIKEEVKSLYEEMQALGQTWEGAAWQTFQGQVTEDIENMQLVEERLAGYLSHMEYAEKEYHNCENQVQMLVRSL